MAEANDGNDQNVKDNETVLVKPADDKLSAAHNESLAIYSDDSIENAISEIVHHEENISNNTANTDATAKCLISAMAIIPCDEIVQTSTTGKVEVEVTKKIALQQLESLSKKSSSGLPASENLSSNGEQKTNVVVVEKDELEKKLLGAGVGLEEKPTKRILNKNAPIANKNVDKDDLIAILQGTDNVKKEEVTIEGEGQFEVFDVIDNDKDSSSGKEENDEKEEKEGKNENEGNVDLQLNNTKPVISPRNRRRKQDISKMLVTDLVTSLASEWSDADEENSEIKSSPSKLTVSPSPIDDSRSKQTTEIIQPEQIVSTLVPYKRTRIIKRKIIWDPDAPETQFSYASLIKTPSNSLLTKKENTLKRGLLTPLPNKDEAFLEVMPSQSGGAVENKGIKRKAEVTSTLVIATKKKKSEVDKLLGDEGAINMLNSLDAERNKSEPKANTKRERTVSPQIKMTTATSSKKRGSKARASSGWDYVYNQRDDDAMIIRRRSNSSYSSNSPRRLSTDVAPVVQIENMGQLSSTPEQSKGRGFEFAKPENKTNKKVGKIDSFSSSSLAADIKRGATRKSSRSGTLASEISMKTNEENTNAKDVVVVKKLGSVTQLILYSKATKANCLFTPQLMNDICTNLGILLDDKNCKVVVLTTAGQHFCQGVDLKNLTVGSNEKRTAYAQELAKSVKNLLLTLTTFTKPIIAGVVGTNSGLGVTMLPLFDVVFGSDKSFFSTAYAEMGHMLEGYSILCSAKNVRHNFKTKMLWLSERITATESVLAGLITKIFATNKVSDEAVNMAKKIASLSSEPHQSMKSQRLKYEWSQVAVWLDEEEQLLSSHWSSSACQERIKKYL